MYIFFLREMFQMFSSLFLVQISNLFYKKTNLALATTNPEEIFIYKVFMYKMFQCQLNTNNNNWEIFAKKAGDNAFTSKLVYFCGARISFDDKKTNWHGQFLVISLSFQLLKLLLKFMHIIITLVVSHHIRVIHLMLIIYTGFGII